MSAATSTASRTRWQLRSEGLPDCQLAAAVTPLLFAAIVVSMATAGCSRGIGLDLVPVTGVVLLDGQPVADATVLFSPTSGGHAGFGTTDAAGRFVAQSAMGGRKADGLVVGEYSVVVQKLVSVPLPPDAPQPPAPDAGGSISPEVERSYKGRFEAWQKTQKQRWEPEKNLVPKIYGDTRTTPLAVQVVRTGSDFTLEMAAR